VHDRRIEGVEYTFGNEGVLFKSAMTWWDWETHSIWSQPWGAAIIGELTGTRLTLLPYELVPWQSWLERHPDTKVLIDERANLNFTGNAPIDHFVIGVSLAEAATGFYFASSALEGVVNETVGDFPVAVFADKESRVIHVFLRTPQPGPNGSPELPDQLTFEQVESADSSNTKHVKDVETGSTWDIEAGVATAGELKGALLQRAPYVSSYYWAWEDFNPHTQFWPNREGRFDELD
jgi:hypothetical protein